MSPRSRRALLQLLGSSTATLLAGCGTDVSTDTPSEESAPPTSTTAAGARTESPTETRPPGVLDCGVAPRPDAAWPLPGGSPARDEYVAERASGVDPLGSGETPSVAWTAEAPPAQETAATRYARPLVGGDSLYALCVYKPGPEQPYTGRVHALDAATGERRWATDRFVPSPTTVLWEDFLILAAQPEYWTTTVVAFDRTDGTRKWNGRFDARVDSVVPAGEHLYLAGEDSSGTVSVRAVAADGSTAWKRALDVQPSSYPDLVPVSDRLYAVTRTGRVLALSRTDGTTRWAQRVMDSGSFSSRASTLSASDCAVFAVTTAGTVHAVDETGTPVWEAGDDYTALATDGETVYATGRDTRGVGSRGWVEALDAATGESRWTVSRDGSAAVLAVTEGTVYTSLGDGLVALDREEGTERWRVDVPLDFGGTALADETLFGLTKIGGEYALMALR